MIPWLRSDSARKAFLFLTSAALAARLFAFIRRYSVNILFWDQWDFWSGLFQGAGPWQLFDWQHGPHREGLGYALIWGSAKASGWDSRTEALAVGGCFVVACGLAFALKRALTGRWSYFDVGIALVFLTIGNVEAYVGTVNPAHGPVTVVLVLAIVLVRAALRGAARTVSTVVLDFLVVFTGFGLLFGPIVSLLLVLDLIAALRSRTAVAIHAAAFAASLAVLALFLHGYVFAPAADCFVFPDPHPLRYLRFVADMAMRALQLHDLPPVARVIAAVPILLAEVFVLGWSGVGMIRSRGQSAPHAAVFALSAFGWVFMVDAAVGRVCMGEGLAYSSRYVNYTLLVPFAAYLGVQSAAMRTPSRHALLVVCLALLVVKEVRTKRTLSEASWYASRKQLWKDCYLRRGDIHACDVETGLPIYPQPAVTGLEAKLRYLREHHLNLFKEGD